MAYNLALVVPFEKHQLKFYDEISVTWLTAWEKKSRTIMSTQESSEQDPAPSSASSARSGEKRTREEAPEEMENPKKKQKQVDAINTKYITKGSMKGGGKLAEENSSFIATLNGENDRIYVLGHCSPGSSELNSSEREGEGQVITAKDLAKFFDTILNLKKSFAGKIKIYGCHSALPLNDKKSFAEQFKDAMRVRNYMNCKVDGYNARVRGYDGDHKVAFIGNDDQFQEAARKEQQFAKRQITKSELDAFYKDKTVRPSTERRTFE